MTHPDNERSTLRRALDGQRRHILDTLTDLTDEQLRTPSLPSGWTPLGLARHLTLADERYWFDSIVGGAPLDWFPSGPQADWTVDHGTAPGSVLDDYRDQIGISNRWIDSTDIESAPRRRDPLWDEWGIDFPDLRTILLHVIVETAVHAGHLDAAVELLDGRQYLVMP